MKKKDQIIPESREPIGKKSSRTEMEVTARFTQAYVELIKMGAVKNKSTFPLKYGINRSNFYRIFSDFPKFKAQVDWLVFIARDYGVSAQWLLLGVGKMFRRKPRSLRYAKRKLPKAPVPTVGGEDGRMPELPLCTDD